MENGNKERKYLKNSNMKVDSKEAVVKICNERNVHHKAKAMKHCDLVTPWKR